MFLNNNYLLQRSSSEECLLTSTLPNAGPTEILPFLYLGSQEDALLTETMQNNHITHVINVSIKGDRVHFLDENDNEHFLRIPINDCHNAQLLPYFDQAYTFIEKARLDNGRVFIHCLAGISRSPALAIAYVMRYLNLSADDAYRYIKQRRSHISPNFNFLGQLFEYERNLSLISTSTKDSTVKCLAFETCLNDRRRLLQVEGCSKKIFSRPKGLNLDLIQTSRSQTFLSPSSDIGKLSVESSHQQLSLPPKLLRPNSITLKRSLPIADCSTLEKKRVKTGSTSSSSETTDLINTFFQETNLLSRPLQQSVSTQSLNSTSEPASTTNNVLSSSRELLVS